MELKKFRKFNRRKTLEAFNCHVCKKFFVVGTAYRTENLIYLCINCYHEELKHENNEKEDKNGN